jgi:hypothetical protein
VVELDQAELVLEVLQPVHRAERDAVELASFAVVVVEQVAVQGSAHVPVSLGVGARRPGRPPMWAAMPGLTAPPGRAFSRTGRRGR